jgi:hypothetical protein
MYIIKWCTLGYMEHLFHTFSDAYVAMKYLPSILSILNVLKMMKTYVESLYENVTFLQMLVLNSVNR